MSTKIHSPLRAEFLLWCYCRCEPHPNIENREEEIAEFVALGIIVPAAHGYATTPLGRAWVQAILNVPIPTAAFIDEQGRVLASS